MIKKVLFTVVNVLSILTIIAAVIVLFHVVFTRQGDAPRIAGYTVLRVTTGSMEPTYKTDTLILVKDTESGKIKAGDVISFYSTDPALDGAVNTHRVVRAEKKDGHWIYTTKGDANNVVDSYEVEEKYLIGKVVGSSLILGKVARLASNPLVFVPVILIPLAVILLSNLVRTVRLTKVLAKEEEEAAIQEVIRQIREAKEKENKHQEKTKE